MLSKLGAVLEDIVLVSLGVSGVLNFFPKKRYKPVHGLISHASFSCLVENLELCVRRPTFDSILL